VQHGGDADPGPQMLRIIVPGGGISPDGQR